MSVFAGDFTYDGTALSSLSGGYMVVALDVGREAAHQRTINHSEITNDNYVQHYYGHVADTPLKLSVTITKSADDEQFTRTDANAIADWLFHYSEPKVLYFTPCESDNVMYEDTDFIGAFTAMEYMDGNDGVTLNFECISGYAFSKVQTTTVDTSVNDAVTITSGGNMAGEIVYPVVRVHPLASGVLTIAMNGADEFQVEMDDGVDFYISDRNMFLTDGSLYSFENLVNFNWPYLKDGDNVWTFGGAAELTIEARYPITTGY